MKISGQSTRLCAVLVLAAALSACRPTLEQLPEPVPLGPGGGVSYSLETNALPLKIETDFLPARSKIVPPRARSL